MLSLLSMSRSKDSFFSFIQEIHLLSNTADSIWLAKCCFDKHLYFSSLFAEFNIYKPDFIDNCILKRQAEFLAGRYMAKLALVHSGCDILQVKTDKHRAPVWPKNRRGSISHTDHLAIAAISQKSLKFLGVDIENIFSITLAQKLACNIHTPQEAGFLTDSGIPSNLATCLIFSAKESLFKATYPHIGHYFGLNNAKVYDLDTAKYILTLELDHSLSEKNNIKTYYACHYKIYDTYIMTLIIE